MPILGPEGERRGVRGDLDAIRRRNRLWREALLGLGKRVLEVREAYDELVGPWIGERSKDEVATGLLLTNLVGILASGAKKYPGFMDFYKHNPISTREIIEGFGDDSEAFPAGEDDGK
jgi:hypothetical protein